MSSPTHTFQTRLTLTNRSMEVFEKMAELFSQIERTLFADIQSGKSINQLKSSYLTRFQITARQFNACRVKVQGLIASRRQRQLEQIQSLKQAIQRLDQAIECLEKKKRCRTSLFYKKQKCIKLASKLQKLESDRKEGIVRICFGTKKLFLTQYHLEEAKFSDFASWKQVWQASRKDQFFFLGSKDESSGNQTCTLLEKEGKLSARIRLPEALSSYGKYLMIEDLFFDYGQKEILSSLSQNQLRKELRSKKEERYKDLGQAISVRFVRDEKGWRMFVSTALSESQWISSSREGVIGVDVNLDHLAIVETDRNGNPLSERSIPLNLYGKTAHQSLAEIGDAVSEVVRIAVQKKKDLVMEKLDFQQKKKELSQYAIGYRRKLSSFAYRKILQTLQSRGYRHGIHVHEIHPAFTSLLGRIKFAKRYGLSIHHAAALCIGRRYSGFSERVPSDLGEIPDGKGGYVFVTVPVRNQAKHAWSHLRKIHQRVQAALAAQYRAVKPIFPSSKRRKRQKIPVLFGESPKRESLTALLG